MKRQKHSAVTRSFALLRRMDSSFFPCVIVNGILQALANFLPAMILAQVINRICIMSRIHSTDFTQLRVAALILYYGYLMLLTKEKRSDIVKNKEKGYHHEKQLSKA